MNRQRAPSLATNDRRPKTRRIEADPTPRAPLPPRESRPPEPTVQLVVMSTRMPVVVCIPRVLPDPDSKKHVQEHRRGKTHDRNTICRSFAATSKRRRVRPTGTPLDQTVRLGIGVRV